MERDIEVKYFNFMWSICLRSLEELYSHIGNTKNAKKCQEIMDTLGGLHVNFSMLLDSFGEVTFHHNEENFETQHSSSLRFTVNTASSAETSSSNSGDHMDQNVPQVSNVPTFDYSHSQCQNTFMHHDCGNQYLMPFLHYNEGLIPPRDPFNVTFNHQIDHFQDQYTHVGPEGTAICQKSVLNPSVGHYETFTTVKYSGRSIRKKPNSDKLGSPGKIDMLESIYKNILAMCGKNSYLSKNVSKISECGKEIKILEKKTELSRDPNVSEPEIRDEGETFEDELPKERKGQKCFSHIDWSSFDIVMPSTKTRIIKNVKSDHIEFPDLVPINNREESSQVRPASSDPSLVKPTENFASVLLKNLTPCTTVTDCGSTSSKMVKPLPSSRSLRLKSSNLILRSSNLTIHEKYKSSGSSFGGAKSFTKEVDKDGWEMVKGKRESCSKRDYKSLMKTDNQMFDTRHFRVHYGTHLPSNPETDLEELRINEEELRKSYELEEQEQILNKKIKDLETASIEDEIDGDDHIIVDPLAMHKNFLEYLKTIPWSDQIVEMEKLAKLLPTGSSDANSFTSATLEQFEQLVAQYPARALELHLKLSSRSERKESEEKNLARRMKANEKRQQLLTEKAAKMRELVQKVEEVKAQQYILAEERKYRLYLKLKKAEENRQQHLSIIRRKAHDEEEKLKEIAFINELEAQNRRHESLALRQEHEERLQNILEERQRKVDEKAAKEAAVEERRRVLEAERQEKLEKMQEKRRRKEEIIGRKQMEKEKERLVIAREKAREREERLQARQAAQLATAEELQKKIQQKQESSARRHEESIEQIRQKALEAGSLRTVVMEEDAYQGFHDEVKSKIDSKGKPLEIIDGKTTEKVKNNRKRAKKIRHRIALRCKDLVDKYRIQHSESDNKNIAVPKLLNIMSTMVQKELKLWENEDILLFEQHVMEVTELLKEKTEQDSFCSKDGFIIISCVYNYLDDLIKDTKSHCMNRIFLKVLNLFKQACEHNLNSVIHMCSSGNFCMLADSLRLRINAVLVGRRVKYCDVIMQTLCEILTNLEVIPEDISRYLSSILADFLGYVLYTGLIGGIIDVIKYVTENDDQKLDFLIAPSLEFFSSLSRLPTKNVEYMKILESSDLMGVVSLMYCSLQETLPKAKLPSFTINTMKFLLAVAQSDIKQFQSILGAEGMYLQLRHIASYLLSFCSQEVEYTDLLHLVIEIIGYFSVHNEHNQMLLQSGQMPTVLQQLVSLPFKYFCEPSLSNILFPTLIACCHNNATNKSLLENELNYNLLEGFLKTDEAYKIKLIRIFLEWKE